MEVGLQACGVRHAICEDFRLEEDLEGAGAGAISCEVTGNAHEGA